MDELLAKNVRPYAPYAEYRLSEIGSIREFTNILRDRAFGFVRLCKYITVENPTDIFARVRG